MSKITLGADDSIVKEDTNILNNLLNGATSTIKAFGEDTAVYYSEKAVGQMVIGALVGGIVLGDQFGDRIPFLGGRR